MNTKNCVGRSSKYTCLTNISTNKQNKCTANLLLERNFVLLKITFKFGYMPQNWTEVQLCHYQSTMAIQIRIICIKMPHHKKRLTQLRIVIPNMIKINPQMHDFMLILISIGRTKFQLLLFFKIYASMILQNFDCL